MADGQLGAAQDSARAYIRSILLLHDDTESQIVQLQDASNKAVGLPPELLAQIFCHLDIHSRFAVSQVCRHWRIAALSFARLWTDMDDFGEASQRLLLALKRACALPVRLGFSLRVVDDYQLATILSCVGRHMHHILALDITLSDANVALPGLSDTLSRPAPILRRLSLYAANDVFTDKSVLQENLFSGLAPHLKQLFLYNIFLPHVPLAAFANVTFFSITATERTPLNRMAHAVLPNLVVYELNLRQGTVIFQSPLYPDASAPNLRILRLNESFSMIRKFPYSSCPRIALLRPPSAYAAVAWATCTPPARFMVQSALSGGRSVDGFYRLTYRFHGYTSVLLRGITQHLRSLVLETITSQHDMDGRRLFQEFPRLTYLHILIASRDGYTAHRPPFPLWLRTPALRVLRLSVVPPYMIENTEIVVWQDRGIGSFLSSLQPEPEGRTVFLETEGFSLETSIPFTPPPFVPRAVSPDVPLYHFRQDRVDQFQHWDDWLVSALDHIPDV